MRGWKFGAAALSAAILCASAARARAAEEASPPGSETEARELRRRQEEIDRMDEQARAMQVELGRRHEHIDRMHRIVLTQQCAVEVAKKRTREAIDQRMEVEAELDHARAETAKLREENVRLEKELHLLRRMLVQVAGPGALERVLRGAEHPPIDGKILAVRPDVDLVMISVGMDDGVTVGLRFTVYRGEKYIGKVEVEKVFADMSSARMLRQWKPFRQGDDASTGLGERAPEEPRKEEPAARERPKEPPGEDDDAVF